MNEGELSEITGLIYETAIAPDRWPDLLQRLAIAFHCHFGGAKFTTTNREQFRAVAWGMDAAVHREALRRFNRTNPIGLRMSSEETDELIGSADVIGRKDLERTEMYQEFLRPHDTGHVGCLNIWRGTAGHLTISLSRSWQTGPFERHERRLARTITPHLRRSAHMARRLHHADLLARTSDTTLDIVSNAILLLDRAGRLLHANQAAMRLLRDADGIRAGRDSILSAATPSATRTLENLIAAAAGFAGTGGTLRLPRPSGKPHLLLLAIPVNAARHGLFVDDAAVVLSIVDPAFTNRIDTAVLASLFGLTRAEAALAAQLLAGHDLPAIAAATGRSPHTVRNLLARVMAKTETNRQSELVGLLGRLPSESRDI